MASMSQPILNERKMDMIFLIGIEEFHVDIYCKLEPRVHEWSAIVCVGDIFVELETPFLRIVSTVLIVSRHTLSILIYTEMYKGPLGCLKRCCSENVSFEKFLEVSISDMMLSCMIDMASCRIYTFIKEAS